MCTSHQPGSVTRFHMAIVAIMVLLLFLSAVITGTCSLSTEGNMLRHSAPAPSHTISQTSMPGCTPGCPMHHAPCPSAPHHGSAACAFCAPPAPSAISPSTLPTGAVTLVAVQHPGLPFLVPTVNLSASPAPPLDPPRSTRPASLRV